MSSPEHPPVGGKTEDRPSDTHLTGAADEERPTGQEPTAGNGEREPTSQEPSGGNGERSARQPGAGNGEPDDSDERLLAPIPAEGTTAPADANRVFGRPTPSSPYARIISSAAMSRQERGAEGSHVGSRDQGGLPAQRPPTPRDVHRIRTQARWALVLGISGLLGSILAFPLGLPLGIAAIVLAVLARRAGRRGGLPVPGATPGLVLGVVATAIASVLLVTAAVFWDEMITYSQCMSGANTQTAKEHCRSHVEEQILDRVGQSR